MFRKLLVGIAALYASLAMAAVDANTASTNDLTTIKGIGPATATRIVQARQQSAFKDWDDFIARTKGVAPTSANKLSEAGLTINGKPYRSPARMTPKGSAPAEKSAKPTQSTGKKPEKS